LISLGRLTPSGLAQGFVMSGWISDFFYKIFPPVFVVEIKRFKAFARIGKVSADFLWDCSDISRQNDIRSGKIYGVKSSFGISLKFSSAIPEQSHQRFRNAWGHCK
jgi:uncharacterized protein DUF3634